MKIYRGSDSVVEFPEIRIGRYTKDFSWGFYCTNNYTQAQKWSSRTKTPVINIYNYIPKENLKVLEFIDTTDEWLDFIVHCRKGGFHDYDIVEGAMTDDTVWDYIEDFSAGRISRAAFWELVKFKHPTHQISSHTLNALSCITYEGSEKDDRT